MDYVRPELSHLNESWVGDSISHRLESAKQRYFDTVGQKMQTKAAPIREGVIVIKQETTMQELQQFAAVCKERFGIEAFQIHIHKDDESLCFHSGFARVCNRTGRCTVRDSLGSSCRDASGDDSGSGRAG